MARNIAFILQIMYCFFQTVNEFSKLVNSWWSYHKKFDTTFLSETWCICYSK